ncbi:chemotaxis protein CheW [Fusobacterium sp. MFO224]|uniref:chemotaxis protein CheW n=1 Tax=Fusobacterium sp. MFO224 TaxID=3378070 RepID=UPI0038548A01
MKKKYMLFLIEKSYYAIEVINVQEIITSLEILDIPRKKSCCEGIVSLRGNILPVIGGRKIFKIEKNKDKEDKTIIVLNNREDSFGLLVEKVIDVIEIDENDFLEADLKNSDQGIIESNEKLFKFKEFTVSILDIELFDSVVK